MKEIHGVGIIGLGLIGGSMALAIREVYPNIAIIGVDANAEHCMKAIELGLVDSCEALDNCIEKVEIIIIATPVNKVESLLPGVLDKIESQIIFDVGSTKANIIQAVSNHPKRGRFVACHPMAGTEFSGPNAAVQGLFKNCFNVICNPDECDLDALEIVENLLESLGMKLIYQEASEHDQHVAYVSHMSHISAFALALTVLHKEKSEEKIFQLASGGFRSSVRLAKSNPDTWAPIFEQNRDAVMDVLDEHITVLSQFRSLLIKKDFDKFHQLMSEANNIKRILNQ